MNAANSNLLKSFLRASAGFDHVHYPILNGEHYEWFVQNEKESHQANGQKVALPDLFANQTTLPSKPLQG